ncbi:MAG: 4-hydroxy-tetrahydrodipicolinate synthase [Candidatus Thermoplasmatota archaeon]|nr:4-hydroxy-tetrahydrodipicolinate synthase [Candidatus Thermoplasmatota archaeon]
MNRELRGSIVPLVTPFRINNSIDFDCVSKLVDWQIRNGTHCISVAGTTGEPTSLSLEEREHLFEQTAEFINGRVPFIAGTGTNNLTDTMRLTKRAERIGADAALVIVPYYVKPSQEALLKYFSRIARSVSFPLIIYNIPGRTATDILPETVYRLNVSNSNIIGIKQSSRDMDAATSILSKCGPDFLLYSGIESLCYPMLAIGGAGHFSATANILPREVAAMYDFAVSGKWKEAMELHFRLFPINEAIFWETNPVPLKAAMEMLGLANNILRPPLLKLPAQKRSKLRKLLEKYGLKREMIV